MADTAKGPPLRAKTLLDASFWGLLGVVLLAPLPLGSNRPWAWFLLGSAVGLVGLCWTVGAASSKSIEPLAPPRLAGWLFAAVCLWAAVQWAPWTPATWHHPLFATARVALGDDPTLGHAVVGRISLTPERTLGALARLLAYGCVFWLALQVCATAGAARRALAGVAWAGFAYALYGLAVHFSGGERVLWIEKWAYRDVVTSTFVNRNSFATYAGLTLLCAGALALERLEPLLRTRAPARTRLRLLLQHVLGRHAPLYAAVIVIATALLLTESRGGVLSAAIGLAALVWGAVAGRRIPRRSALAFTGVALVAALTVVVVSGRNVFERLGETTADVRRTVYPLVVRAIQDTPFLGTGYGSFRHVFPLHRDEGLAGPLVWDTAHSTYLENALELGIPAAVALCVAILACTVSCGAALRDSRDSGIHPALGVAATALVAAHAIVDFSLQTPAVAVTYSFILGVACARSSRRSKPTRSGVSSESADRTTLRPSGVADR